MPKATLEQLEKTKEYKMEFDLALEMLEDSLYTSTYLYMDIPVFVTKIDIDSGLLAIITCDDSHTLFDSTDEVVTVDIKEFLKNSTKL